MLYCHSTRTVTLRDMDTEARTGTFERLTVAEAAERLGVTPNAVRQRMRRGSIRYEKDENGLTFVYLHPEDTRRDDGERVTERVQDTNSDASHDTLIEELQEQNRRLWQELADRSEELRRRDHIIMSLTQRIPELEPVQHEAKPETPEASETPVDTPSGTHAPEMQPKSHRRSWWRRFFDL